MKTKSSITVKAVVLLFVFLLNTVVGFACTIGMEASNEHTHGEKEHHEHKHSSHHHDGLVSDLKENHHHPEKSSAENCCKDEVSKIMKADKLLTVPGGLDMQSLMLFAVLPVFCQNQLLAILVHTPNNKYFVRSYHPPISDIRISIQSFQI